MKIFEAWLRERLEAAGCIGGEIEDNDLHATIERFQRARGIDVSGIANPETISLLRQQKSSHPGSTLIFFHAVPPSNGSIYAGVSV